LALSDQYGFVIAADERYSDIYADESNPPPGLLGACVRLGRLQRTVVFHSLKALERSRASIRIRRRGSRHFGRV
jgi:DNA-binding transcriptional MocR family regulator